MCVICLLLLCIVIFFLDDLPANPVMLGGGLLLMGFLLFGPDSILTGAAAIDFGTKKGASTATGFVNGCGSVGAIIGGTIPGLFVERWGWNGVFMLLAGMVLLAGLILAPMWNTLPKKE
ncbi:MAG: MFS transporter [Planctomycetota bacterium]|nr:MFS transporter [Planctomycetota bacterium]